MKMINNFKRWTVVPYWYKLTPRLTLKILYFLSLGVFAYSTWNSNSEAMAYSVLVSLPLCMLLIATDPRKLIEQDKLEEYYNSPQCIIDMQKAHEEFLKREYQTYLRLKKKYENDK